MSKGKNDREENNTGDAASRECGWHSSNVKDEETTTQKFFLDLVASVIYTEMRPATSWVCAAGRPKRVSDALSAVSGVDHVHEWSVRLGRMRETKPGESENVWLWSAQGIARCSGSLWRCHCKGGSMVKGANLGCFRSSNKMHSKHQNERSPLSTRALLNQPMSTASSARHSHHSFQSLVADPRKAVTS